MNKEQFARCPFCGKSDTLTIGKASDAFSEPDDCGDPMPYMHTESYAVTCDASKPDGPGGCGASGGYKLTEDEAIAAWNRRAEVERLAAHDRLVALGLRLVGWAEITGLAQLAEVNGTSVWVETPRIHDPTPGAPGPAPKNLTAIYAAFPLGKGAKLYEQFPAFGSLSASEQQHILSNPHALEILMDYHDQQQDQAESTMGPEDAPHGDERRTQELKEKGRSIMAEDLEIWSDALLRRFGFSVIVAQPLAQAEPAPAPVGEYPAKALEGVQAFEFDPPPYHSEAMGCGLEDRGITDRYEAMYYGWHEAMNRAAELVPDDLVSASTVAALQARIAELEAKLAGVTEAVCELLSNEDHALSSGIPRGYSEGSQTWDLWEQLRQVVAIDAARKESTK